MSKLNIEKKLTELNTNSESRLTWWEIGLLLQEIRDTEYYRPHNRSFSSWLRENAHLFNAKPNTLWRALSAVNFTISLQEKYDEMVVPEFSSYYDSISPESIEVLSKLFRVLKEEELGILVEKVYQNTISRRELREQWQTYRVALGPLNARGRKEIKPKIDHEDIDQQITFLESVLLSELKKNPQSWNIEDKEATIRYYLHLRPDEFNNQITDDIDIDFLFSCIATRKESEGILQYHGFINFHKIFNGRIGSKEQKELFNYLANGFCEYIWLIMSNETKEYVRFIQKTYPNIGIITLDDHKLKVIQNPVENCLDINKYKLLTSIIFDRTYVRDK